MELSTSGLVLASDAAIDLQMHTILSDGQWTPEQLIDYLAGEGFGLAAITDHDRMDTAVSLQQLTREKHFPLMMALEMSTLWQGEMTDILCYGFDPENIRLGKLMQDALRRQQENTQEVYEKLLKKGYTFPEQGDSGSTSQQPDALDAILEKPSAQQPAEMAALVERHGYGGDGKSGWAIIIEAGAQFSTNDIADAVDAAQQSGAVCVIAHPGRADGFVPFTTDRLDQLRAEVPVDGFEAYYPLHTPEQTAMYVDYARRYGLVTSSGSDSHGPDRKPIKYRADLSRGLLERLGIRVS